MNFDFDTLIERRGSGSIKYDRRPELDPFWVADMDFASAPAILDALHRRVDHGAQTYGQLILGLSRPAAQVPRTATVETIFGTAAAIAVEAIKFHQLYPDGEV